MKTERLWSSSAWTSSKRAPPELNAAAMASIVARSRPSEKFGTDSRGRGTARSLGSVKAYYDRRAPEYDEWYRGAGRFAERERPGWEQEVEALGAALAALPPARTLDVACGTGFLTRHLPGEVVGLDQSESMLEEARRQAPNATYVQGDALTLPFEDGSFDRVFTAHFYGHLEGDDRERFLGRGAAAGARSSSSSTRPCARTWSPRSGRSGS